MHVTQRICLTSIIVLFGILSFFVFNQNHVAVYLLRFVISLAFLVWLFTSFKNERRWTKVLYIAFAIASFLFYLYVQLADLGHANYTISVVGGVFNIVGYFAILVHLVRNFNIRCLKENYLYLVGFAIVLLFTSYQVMFYLGPITVEIKNTVVLTYLLTIVLLNFFSFANFISLSGNKTLWMFVACLCFLFSEFLQVFLYLFQQSDGQIAKNSLILIGEHLLPILGYLIIFQHLYVKDNALVPREKIL